MKKYLKLSYVTSYFRLLFMKLLHFRAVKLSGFKYFIGKKISIESKNGGKIYLGDKVYLSDYCHLHSSGSGLKIGFNTFFNRDCKIVSMGSIEIGENCLFGANVGIYDHNHRFDVPGELICRQGMTIGSVVVGSDVWIGNNVVITEGVTIGDHVIVGANSVVTHDLEGGGLYAGAPAKFIRKI